MKNRVFARLLQQLKGLTPSQKGKLESTLHQEGTMDIVSAVIEEPQHCPHCASDKYQKWGVRSGLQRYRCNRCKRTYNALTGTPLARLRHKEVWADFAKDLMKSATVRENTAFRWRHRMLNNAKRLDRHLHGIVAFDETYFLESRKGERNLDRNPRKRGGKAAKRGISSEQTAVLVARSRTAMDAVLFKSNQDTLAEVMSRAVDNDALLCSDKKPSYRAFARKHHRIPKTINAAKEHVSKGIYPIQNVNAYDSRLKRWMQHFHGVATKYLESYLGWMRLLDREKELTPKRLLGILARRGMVCQPLMGT